MMTKETGIIFSTEMVKAILDGRKTMTRRTRGLEEINKNPDDWTCSQWALQPAVWDFHNIKTGDLITMVCPYGGVGDWLWVRETYYRYGRWAKNGFTKAGKQAWKFVATTDQIRYTDNPPEKIWDGWTREQLNSRGHSDWYKRPSIHMPKWAARIWRQITGLRAYRLQEITITDCVSEGIGMMQQFNEGIAPFKQLWDSLNAKRGYSWDVNPWCWCISF